MRDFIVITAICSAVHWSKLTDLTLEMCTPRFRWIPAHRIQMNTPRFHEVHRGPLASQSAQYLLSSSRSSVLNTAWNFSCIRACLSFDDIFSLFVTKLIYIYLYVQKNFLTLSYLSTENLKTVINYSFNFSSFLSSSSLNIFLLL